MQPRDWYQRAPIFTLMTAKPSWMLPEGVEEILPDEAKALEQLRRQILDDFESRGFELVMPPVMEFVDALLTGTGEELDTQTYKFMDQHTQRMLGVRADITPQIARIDAHYLQDRAVNRLCYSGSVLRTRPETMGGQRELLQIGAEVFGVDGVEADLEILDALLSTLALSGAKELTLSLGHVGVYSQLMAQQSLSAVTQARLLDVLQRKSDPDLDLLSSEVDIKPFKALLQWQGGAEVIETARQWLHEHTDLASGVEPCLQALMTVIDVLKSRTPRCDIHIDLADVSGYRYHTGLKYSAFVTGRGRAIAKGGRYDRIGEQFGRARPATGFSADLKTLFRI